jgi:hypothetical protein
MAFWSDFLSSGVEGAARGIGGLAKDIRAAITGEEPLGDKTRLQLEEIAVQLELVGQQLPGVVNQTMQIESKSEHWPQYSWRPFWGFVSAVAFLAVCVFCCILGYRAVMGSDPTALATIPQLISSFATLFAIPGAILGVTAWHRGKEKRGI